MKEDSISFRVAKLNQWPFQQRLENRVFDFWYVQWPHFAEIKRIIHDMSHMKTPLVPHAITKLGGNRTKYSITIDSMTPPKTNPFPLL